MNRYEDITELLKEVESNLAKLQNEYDKARKDEKIKFVLRPLVKTSLEHLRSVLEYSAQDIWASYNSSIKKLYFPYGKDEALFKANVKRNLPKLHEHKSLYEIVEFIQPHRCKDDWLIELCDQTNFNKHNSLGKQTRENSDNSTTDIGRLARISGGGTITFTNCSYNGMPLGRGAPAVISGKMPTEEIRKNIGIPVPVTREFDWVEFRFENSTKDTLQLIEKALSEISAYIEKLKNELTIQVQLAGLG